MMIKCAKCVLGVKMLRWILAKRQEINIGENVEKRELSRTVGGNINWQGHYGKQYGGSSRQKQNY